MTSLRQFCLDDLLRFNAINLDVLTETYNGTCETKEDSKRLFQLILNIFVKRLLLHVVFVEMAGIVCRYVMQLLVNGALHCLTVSFKVAEAPQGQLMGYVLGKVRDRKGNTAYQSYFS